MKRVVKLTEQDLYRIVKRVIKEQAATAPQTQAAKKTPTGTPQDRPKVNLEVVNTLPEAIKKRVMYSIANSEKTKREPSSVFINSSVIKGSNIKLYASPRTSLMNQYFRTETPGVKSMDFSFQKKDEKDTEYSVSPVQQFIDYITAGDHDFKMYSDTDVINAMKPSERLRFRIENTKFYLKPAFGSGAGGFYLWYGDNAGSSKPFLV